MTTNESNQFLRGMYLDMTKRINTLQDEIERNARALKNATKIRDEMLAELLFRYKNGDTDAFKELVKIGETEIGIKKIKNDGADWQVI